MNLKWKYILIAVITILGILGVKFLPLHKGLDLQGGMHLILQVKADEAIKADRDRIMDALKEIAKKSDITIDTAEPEEQTSIKVKLADIKQENDFRKFIKAELPAWNLESNPVPGTFVIKMLASEENAIKDQSISQAIEILRNRVDEFGLTEPLVQRQGLRGDKAIIELPGVDDPARVKKILKETALLEFRIVLDFDMSRDSLIARYQGKLPEDSEILLAEPIKTSPEQAQDQQKEAGYYLVKKSSPISGKDLRNARRGTDNYGLPQVDFEIKRDSTNTFGKFTSENVGQRMAIVLDKKVMSAPNIQDAIYNAGRITGNFTPQEAEDLALVLRTGALPASMEILEERTVGPSLGKDSINRGFFASLLGTILILAFMTFYYRLAGINAIVALSLNILIIFAVLAYFEATLTLPGIAGIALTIGMAVDANILIFERIKEELALGKTVRSSIESGFSRAFTTIIDTNLTTILAAIFLYMFGTGPVRGFALTLTIGLLANMFTAVFVSRVIFDTFVRERKTLTLSI
ncbi:MAG: protein-export membrane protein SecD [Candidatus Fischerbacteria bacterium RBG_13_37_8]|uniref:Protein translocase subunit SecD n=1 Tax=Candidatus Fischerbacteria bacterium RBG_13_37_8 TaxID=1817863 RepID=A0A1F5VKW6_9BACT|nr:MAG: protein-export membrane protein SecD [Candidatus Fischerbacteria bacterium RBG_13_37_8]